mmetsp:Transcript_1512/g.3000  ORF Transcript_1512/g.3000 Transcript_1512/m.3000 type:complete len:215 (-) Transcript_1512:688-1332(-)
MLHLHCARTRQLSRRFLWPLCSCQKVLCNAQLAIAAYELSVQSPNTCSFWPVAKTLPLCLLLRMTTGCSLHLSAAVDVSATLSFAARIARRKRTSNTTSPCAHLLPSGGACFESLRSMHSLRTRRSSSAGASSRRFTPAHVVHRPPVLCATAYAAAAAHVSTVHRQSWRRFAVRSGGTLLSPTSKERGQPIRHYQRQQRPWARWANRLWVSGLA